MQENLRKSLVERFFRYLAVSSQSKEGVEEVPSSSGQMDLAKLLAEELKELDFIDVQVNQNAVAQGMLPARLHEAGKTVPAIAWICHMDTVDVGLSPEIKPILIENYQGGEIVQNQELGLRISPEENPEILDYIGDDLIVSDGQSVLGADNKAAIANVMTAMEYLQEHPEIEHGEIYLVFVPDEEVGLRGARCIDYDALAVDFAYTIDCCALGEVVLETFNAGSGLLKITGVTAHPMSSKNNLVNPIMVAHDFISLLNRAETPECTERKEGYIWVTDIHSDVLHCEIVLNIRDHSKEKYEAKKAYLAEAVKLTQVRHPKAKMELQLKDVYGNISDSITEDNQEAIKLLYQALDELEISAKTIAMRGGTDGSYVSTKGILTPNYFTGALNFHSSAEFLPLSSFTKSCQTTLKIIELAVANAK